MLKDNFKGIFSTNDAPFRKAVPLSLKAAFTKQNVAMQKERELKTSDHRSKLAEVPKKLRMPVIVKKLTGWLSGLLAWMLCICFLEIPVFAESIQFFDREQDYIPLYGAAEYSDEDSESTQPSLYAQTPVIQFRVSNLSPQAETDLDYTDWWYSKWEDCHYVFLPVTADRRKLIITYETEDASLLYLNGVPVVSGQMTDRLSKADEFAVTVGDVDCGKLKVMQSNLGCIYLTTASGGLDALDANKGLVETGSVLMLNASGGTEYDGSIEKINGRGNSSWDYSLKKPYNIKLPKKENLYGMGKAKKWALIGNYLDHSMLRNQVSLEISRAAGMEYVMDSVFVDLYADGSYRGTYQLSERVQIQKNRVNIRDLEEETEELNENDLDAYNHVVVGASSVNEYMENSYKYYDIPNNPDDITGGYLLQFQLWNRYGAKAKSGFVTSRGQAIEIVGPEYASQEQVLYIRNFVQEMEDAIYSDTGYNEKGKHYSEYIDVDSLITAYLVQEISMNVDATSTSFFLWKDSDFTGDGKLHCGPAWDFDLSYNNFPTSRANSDGDIGFSWNTNNLFVTCFPISGYGESGRPTCGISWIGQLYKDEEIVRRVSQIYFERFDSYLSDLTDSKRDGGALITNMAEEILLSAEMNNARWHMYGGREYCVFGSSSGENFMGSVELVRSFIEKRRAWLRELWMPLSTKGDVNADGTFNVADVVAMQKWLLRTGDLNCWQLGDLYEDGVINILDLCVMKKELLILE